MPFSHLWRDYNTQRDRRLHLIPKLILVSQSYVHTQKNQVTELHEAGEHARQMKEFGFALIGEQFAAEKNFSKQIRSFLIACHHHPALIAKISFHDIEHELLDAEAQMHMLHTFIIGTERRRLQHV